MRKALIAVAIMVVVLAVIVGIVGVWQWASSLKRIQPLFSQPICETTTEYQRAELSIEQSQNAVIITSIAAERGLAPRAVSIALTTAFQESKILNLDYGDRDSLGLFQQRPSQGWGTPEQIMDPYYSTGKFYDAMVNVKDWESADIGDVAQAVQRSGFPDAYDKHVSRARLLASALSGQTPASWSCLVVDPVPADPDQLLDAMTLGFGSTIETNLTSVTDSTPAQITIEATSEAVAWSSAAFAQSWASLTGVSGVRVGTLQWQASATEMAPWIDDPTSQAPATTVVISF